MCSEKFREKNIFRLKQPISKPGYLKQRLKLSPEVFLGLLRYHATTFYLDRKTAKKWKDFLILAVDGSLCNVPLSAENVSRCGNTAKKGGKERPQVGISCLFDVCNRMIIDMSTAQCKFDERAEAIKHIDSAKEVIDKQKSICIFDRSYPSGIIFMDLMEQARAIKLRFVKITLENGNDEYLITNIKEEDVSTNEMKELYHMRWEIESAYDDMKNKLQMENFTGSKVIIIEQDIYATGYLYNSNFTLE